MDLFPDVKTLDHRQFAFRIVLLYILVGILWLLFSDVTFTYLFSDSGYFSSYVHYKRILNILITASLLYFLVRKTLQLSKTQHSLNAGIDNWKFVLEGPGDGVWDWDLRSNELIRSARWKEMFGYPDIELGTAPEDTLQLIHPEDIQHARKDIDDFIAGKIAVVSIPCSATNYY